MRLVAATGFYEDDQGRQYVRCAFVPDHPVFIDITEDRWSATWRGTVHWADWAAFAGALPASMLAVLRRQLKERLAKSAPTYLTATRLFLHRFVPHWKAGWRDFAAPSLLEWRVIWSLLDSPQYRGRLRSLYCDLAEQGLLGACPVIAVEMTTWRAMEEKKKSLRDVVEWHALRGAMTSAEQELLRRALHRRPAREPGAQHLARVAAWLTYETLKRPSQLCEMRADAVVTVLPERGEPECFVRVPKVKGQAGREAELWPITTELAAEIRRFSLRPGIEALQAKHNRLLVSKRSMTHGEIAGTTFAGAISRWAATLDITSPRTAKRLHVTPYRIRHTGATRMAAQGVSSDEIQYILEHDHPDSCQAYIDAIGSDLCPAIELAGRSLGEVFAQLNELFFRGRLSSEAPIRPIAIPVVAAQPAIVGSCGLDGRCDRHPFYKCYDGCRYFLAWREADHRQALAYVEAQLARWDAAEGHNERSKAMKDFDRLYRAILDVIRRIEQEKADERARAETLA